MRDFQSNNTYMNNGNVEQNIDKSKTIIKGNRIQIIAVVAIIIVVVGYIMYSQINPVERKIIGTWKVDKYVQIYITFGEDTSFSMSGGGDYLDGNYTFLSDNKIQIHMNYLWADIVLSGDISISGNNMTITNISDPDDIFGADGATLTLTKTN